MTIAFLRGSELSTIVTNSGASFLKYKDKIKSIDIVEFNPLNDQNNKTLKIIIEILQIFISNLSKEKSATR